MKKHIRLFFITLFLLTSFSVNSFSQDTASVTSTVDTDTVQYATIYVYRPNKFEGSAIGYNVYLNDNVICRAKNNTKYAIKVFKEGPVELWAETEKKQSMKLNVKFGQEYYLKCGIAMGIMIGRPDMNLIYPEQGRLDFEHLNARNTRQKK